MLSIIIEFDHGVPVSGGVVVRTNAGSRAIATTTSLVVWFLLFLLKTMFGII